MTSPPADGGPPSPENQERGAAYSSFANWQSYAKAAPLSWFSGEGGPASGLGVR